MLNFLYSGDYKITTPPKVKPVIQSPSFFDFGASSSSPEVEPDTSQDLLTHTGVYLIAEEKDIPALKQLAKRNYEDALPHGWNSEEFCTSLKLIYDGTPETDRLLWDCAIKYAGSRAKQLLDRREFVSLWKENGEFGLEVFKAFLSLNSAMKNVECLRPEGCPNQGVLHARSVVKGRGARYFCTICRKPFN